MTAYSMYSNDETTGNDRLACERDQQQCGEREIKGEKERESKRKCSFNYAHQSLTPYARGSLTVINNTISTPACHDRQAVWKWKSSSRVYLKLSKNWSEIRSLNLTRNARAQLNSDVLKRLLLDFRCRTTISFAWEARFSIWAHR